MPAFQTYAGVATQENMNNINNLLRHNARTIHNPSNKDIDFDRTYKNETYSPDRGMTPYLYYKERLSELWYVNRKDVKSVVEIICSAPKDLPDDQLDLYFQTSYDFIKNRFGGKNEENILLAVTHFDEGVTQKDKDGSTLVEAHGDPIIIAGRPHLHVDFIPTVPDDNPKHVQEERICKKEVVNKQTMIDFHRNLAKAYQNAGLKGTFYSGITKTNGNRTVHELKEHTREQMEKERTDSRRNRPTYREKQYLHSNEKIKESEDRNPFRRNQNHDLSHERPFDRDR